MPERIITHGFTTGEVSPAYWSRTDLEKYDLGVALAENWYVDYRGGLNTRPGTRFVGFADERPKMFTFQTEFTNNSNYLILVDRRFIRIMQDGRYLLSDYEDSFSSVSYTSPTRFADLTITNHELRFSDFIILHTNEGDYTVRVINVIDSDTVRVSHFNREVQAVWNFSSGAISKILTLDHPYEGEEIQQVRATQYLAEMYFTHVNHSPRVLTLGPDGTWTFEPMVIGAKLDPPTNVELNVKGDSNADTNATVGVAVTSVGPDGEESLPTRTRIREGLINYTVDRGAMSITFTPAAGARFYNIYRTSLVTDTSLTDTQELGFIGTTSAPFFVDANITPDFSRKPPSNFNPFANSSVLAIEITDPGAGYDQQVTAEISSSTGSGFLANAARVPSSGEGMDLPPGYEVGSITGIIIVNGGEGYNLSDTVSFDGEGTGAEAEIVELSPPSNNYPSVAAVFQQRMLFAGSRNQPTTVWATRPGTFTNFDFSDLASGADGYQFTLDSRELNPIKHLVPIRDGMLIFHPQGVERLIANEGKAVTAGDAAVEFQSAVGISDTEPVVINNDIVFSETRGTSVQSLAFTFYTNSYSAQDLSILSSHLMDTNRSVKRMVWKEEPEKTVWAVRSDGTILALAYLREQEVFAWTQHKTRGRFVDAQVVREPDKDVLYVAVERLLGNRLTVCIEAMQQRDFSDNDQAWCVDYGLSSELNFQSDALRINKISEVLWRLRPLAPDQLTEIFVDFTDVQVGDYIRAAGGVFVVEEVVSSSEVTATAYQQPTEFVALTGQLFDVEPGKWSLDRPQSTFSGLDFLEGQEVQILADGDVVEPQVVSEGKITLDVPASFVIVGLGYTCRMQTLPVTTPGNEIDGMKKRMVGAAVQTRASRGLKIGPKGGPLYEVKETFSDYYGQIRGLQDGVSVSHVNAKWDYQAQLEIVQDKPLPASVLGLVYKVDL